MYHLEIIASGRYDVRTENGLRVGALIGATGNWCAEVGNRVVGYFDTQDDAAKAILKDRGIKGIFEQMTEIIQSERTFKEDRFQDFDRHDRNYISQWACATNLIWIVRPYATHMVALDLATSQREGTAVLNAVNPDITGLPWKLYLINADKLKVEPITEEKARTLVAEPPKYGISGGAITSFGNPIAHVSFSQAHGYQSFDRRCHIKVNCITEPSKRELQAIIRMAYIASSSGYANEGTPVSLSVFFGNARLYSWSLP